ncbi:AtuA-related protein [Sphingobium boeckii]|uniref:AtuA-like ferredoxin-fold domain-containing protein n=1 Tax=Sphingobium boeckii TaxID=1082345 RepID=A0A7W9AFK8_9SPHN|nr:hypothetical protein [Sphingobium boeckii]MBB5684757.1 hypothetical protein [Sphingobium boeckii]
MTTLRNLAHVRTGDKGDTCQFSVIVHEARHYELLEKYLTPERVGQHFVEFAHGRIRRFEMAQLGALVFVLEQALRSGVTRSLSLDAHGKCLGMTLLSIDIPDDGATSPHRTG